MVGILFLFLLTHVQGALLGHYKLYDSKGNAFYDSTGNSRHAEVWVTEINNLPILTDRGQYFYDNSCLNFPSNSFKDFPESSNMVVSLWLSVQQGGFLFKMYTPKASGYLYNLYIKWGINGSTVRFVYGTDFSGDLSSVDTTLISSNI
jgi:hypothetical protein